MNKLITLFERQKYSFQILDLRVNDPAIEILDRINQKAGIELISIERKGLSTTQYVGIIQAGETTIQILPKIDCNPEASSDAILGSLPYQQAASSAAHNFLYLLAHSQDLKLHELPLSSLSSSQGSWFEMLIRFFSNELLIQLQQGFDQDYVRREDLLPFIRGRWNISRQFISQPDLTRGLDVSYDDYLPDTLLNRVFRLTVNRLCQITQEVKNRQVLTEIDSILQPIHLLSKIDSTDLDKIVINRLNERFSTVFKLARLFLESQTIQTFSGKHSAYSFVFNMDQLFEKFVANTILTQKQKIFPTLWQDLIVDTQSKLIKKFLVKPPFPSEQSMFPLKPDILLNILGVPNLIIDTKNKALPLKQSHRSVAESDAYQMLAYATQFQCPNVLLLYPRTLGSSEIVPVTLSIEQSQIKFFVATLSLHQPLYRLDPLIMELRQILESILTQEMIPRR